jgi:hypothetical protein
MKTDGIYIKKYIYYCDAIIDAQMPLLLPIHIAPFIKKDVIQNSIQRKKLLKIISKRVLLANFLF